MGKFNQRQNVSIPHRYAKNLQQYGGIFFLGVLFQFLIGTLKTYLLVCVSCSICSVSIPHRYAKNRSISGKAKYRANCFNSS